MMEEVKIKRARDIYNSLCEMLDAKNFKYIKHADKTTIAFAMVGDDFPMQFVLIIDAERELVRLISTNVATFPEDKRLEGAIVTSQTNYRLMDGSFDYDVMTGKVSFRITTSFADSLISKEVLEYMIGIASYTVDDYNDKFFMVAKGKMTLEEFFKEED